VIKLLQSRFGTDNQAERYCAELASCIRAKGESLQSVYNDMRRLLALAFLGEGGSMLEIVGRDYFLAALNDPQLRIRVLDQSPASLDQTLSICLRMEAYSESARDSVASDMSDRRKIRVVKADDPSSNSDRDDTVRRLCQLEQDLAAQPMIRRQIQIVTTL